MRNYRNYTDEDVINYSKEVTSVADLLRKLGLVAKGGNYQTMKRHLSRLNVDTSHWTGCAWSKDVQLKDWDSYIKPSSLKKILLRERGHKCESCSLEKWMNDDIPLELEHVDGDNTNNEKSNLLLLCCNCHALTSTWRGRKLKGVGSGSGIRKKKKKKKKKKYHCQCGNEMSRKAKQCLQCSQNTQREHIPSKEQLIEDKEKLKTWTAIGKKYGVSDSAARKWYKKHELIQQSKQSKQ